MSLWWIVPGLLLIGFAAYLDLIVRLRLRDAGERSVFTRAAALDYGRYLRLCDGSGWSRWTVYLIPVFLLAGIAGILLGLLKS